MLWKVISEAFRKSWGNVWYDGIKCKNIDKSDIKAFNIELYLFLMEVLFKISFGYLSFFFSIGICEIHNNL